MGLCGAIGARVLRWACMTAGPLTQFAKDVRAAWERLWPNLAGSRARMAADGAVPVSPPRPARAPVTAWTMVDGLDPAAAWVRELTAHYGQSASFPGSISPQAGMLLHALTLNHRPRVAVEVGSFLGASTVWIASAMEANGVLHAVDRFELSRRFAARRPDVPEDVKGAFDARIERAGLSARVRSHVGDSPTLLREMRRELLGLGGVDLAFIDGDHTIPGVVRDFWAVEPALTPGAIVVFHDTNPMSGHEGPRYVIEALKRNALGVGSRYEITELSIAPLDFGLAVARRIE